MKILSLNEGWKIRESNSQIYYGANVPAMVSTVLYENGCISDPYFGENEWETYEELRKDYEFTNTFEITEDMLNSHDLHLKCDGIDTVADIYINETHVISVDDMHRTFKIDLKDLVSLGINQIKIYFHSAIEHALALHKEEPYYSTSDTVDGFSLVRKAHCTYGWDWGPKLPDMGIWRDISIITCNYCKISDVYIKQDHSENKVGLDINLEIEKYLKDCNVDLNINIKSPLGEIITLSCENIKEKDTYHIDIANPLLWWCNGFGRQHLYEVSIDIKKDSEVLESKFLKIGLRNLTVRREKDQWGETFEYSLNGVSIFAMGANYIPEDSMYSRTSKARTENLIKQCIKANYNCIRVWGGGYFCEDYFYDLCDQYGLIVWQDLLFACGVYRLRDSFVENVVQETIDNVKRLRHHASIGMWCGNNELEWGWSGWDMGFGDKLSDKADYIKLFEWILPETVKNIDPERFYWLASPSSGGSFDDPNDQNRGDVHYWDVWHRLKHFTEYRKYYFRFCSEFGFQAFPCIKTINSFTTEEDKNIFSRVMENHQKNGGANGKILYYLSSNFKYPTSFETLIYVSQILQAEAIRYGVEHWRSNRGRCMGSLYWQLNDCWPVASWSSIDYFNRWKLLHYYAKKFYAPLLLSALEEKGKVDFVISNETLNDAHCKVIWKIRDNDGNILKENSFNINVPKLSAVKGSSEDFQYISQDKIAVSTQYLEYTLYCDDELISNNTLLFARPKHFDFKAPNIKYQVKEEENNFLLTLTTDNYAKYVTVDCDDFDFILSDNCFDISKGETKAIEILKEDISINVTVEDFEKIKILSAYDIK